MMKEPRLDLSSILGVFFILLGMLLILINLHLMSIENVGAIGEVLSTTFTIFLWVFFACLLFAGVTVVIQLLRWLVWSISTPEWMKNKQRIQRHSSEHGQQQHYSGGRY